MNRDDFKRLSRLRIKEAHVLLNASEYSGAYYLAGYSVECALKACIAKNVQRFDFPDKDRVQKSYSHKLTELAVLAGVMDDLKVAQKDNAKLYSSWSVAINWTEQSRYLVFTKTEAEDLLTAIGRRGNGVLPWVMQRW